VIPKKGTVWESGRGVSGVAHGPRRVAVGRSGSSAVRHIRLLEEQTQMECDYCHREFDPIATRWLCPHCHMKANCCDGAPLPQIEMLRRVSDLLRADQPTAR
jgi:hypothetical protein